MSSKHSFKHFTEQELGKFPHFVIYAILEWTLIALLFLDGFLALVSSEFAEFFDLHAPCVLCTRIDHVLAKKRSKCNYNDSICEGHKKDLSPLAYCHVHRKLSDIRRMCEGCLLSFATDNNCEAAYSKSLNGAINKNMEGLFDVEMRARLNMMQSGGKAGNIQCSCCGDSMIVKSSGGFQKGNNNISNTPTLSSLPSRISQAPANSPRGALPSRFAEEAQGKLESHLRSVSFKLPNNNSTPEEEEREKEEEEDKETKNSAIPASKGDATPSPGEADDPLEELIRTPSFAKGNRLFNNIQSTNSAASSPRFANRMPRKSLIDKVELASDPVEAITSNETNIEAILNRLKDQVRTDKKTLIALYMELDEERSASAVAANNAMAMITRLQAEKAAVQMEALQYQRMMEEQAEYDQEALEMLRDCLAKREDEIGELEAELDIYRERYGLLPEEETREHLLQKSQSFDSVTERSDHGSPLFSIDATDTEMDVHDQMSDSEDGQERGFDDDDDYRNEDVGGGASLVDIERERSYLLGQVRMLESRILLNSADNVASAGQEEQTDGKDEMILKEVSDIGQKLRALEEDSRFLRHALLTLQKDRKQGSKLLMEIAQNLQKLRQMDNMPLTPTPTITVAS